jgi:hypothetical protein
MVLQSIGPISLSNIQTEFGGTNPIQMSEYYRGNGLVQSTQIPTSGTPISFSLFYGLAASPSGPPTSGLIAHYDANSHTSGSTTWNDLSGNGLHLTLNNSGIFQTLDNVKHMNLSTTTYSARRSPGLSAYANSTMIIFTSILNNTSGYRTLLRHPTTVQFHHVLVNTGTNTLGLWNGAFFSSGVQVNNITNAFTKFNMWVFKFSQTSPFWQVSCNGPTVLGSITDATASVNQAIGAFGNNSADSPPSQPWGRLAQILYYNRHLTDSEITQIYNTYRSRYGI